MTYEEFVAKPVPLVSFCRTCKFWGIIPQSDNPLDILTMRPGGGNADLEAKHNRIMLHAVKTAVHKHGLILASDWRDGISKESKYIQQGVRTQHGGSQ